MMDQFQDPLKAHHETKNDIFRIHRPTQNQSISFGPIKFGRYREPLSHFERS